MPIDPRVQFISDGARAAVLIAYAARRVGARTERMTAALAAHEAEHCTHVPKALRLGESGLGCRRCAASFVYEGHAAEANERIAAALDQEEATRAPPILAGFGELWLVPVLGPCAAIPRHLESSVLGMTAVEGRIVGEKTDLRVQLGVELQIDGMPAPVPIPIEWLLAHGRRVA